LVPLDPVRFNVELLGAAAQAKVVARAVGKITLASPQGASSVARPPAADFRSRRSTRENCSAGRHSKADTQLRPGEVERLAREERERRCGLLGLGAGAAGERWVGEETPFYKTWWFWSVVGGVVTGSVAGAAFGTRGSGNPASIDVHWTPR